MAVSLGAIVGWKDLLPPSWRNHIPRWSRRFLLLMLFSLGAKLGASTEVKSHLTALGLKALVISLATILGSALVTAITTPLIRCRSLEEESSTTNVTSVIHDT